jgi:hypothetical protein
MRPNGCDLSKAGEEEQNGAREIPVGCQEEERIHRHDHKYIRKSLRFSASVQSK